MARAPAASGRRAKVDGMRLAPLQLQLVLALGVAHRSDRGIPPRATSPRLDTAAPPLIRLPAPPRLVAVGDVHGDVQSLLEVLELAGLYSERRWTDGRAVLVQIGDILDRGDDEAACLDLCAPRCKPRDARKDVPL